MTDLDEFIENKDRKIKLKVENDLEGKILIEEYFIEKRELDKIYNILSRGDYYRFQGWINKPIEEQEMINSISYFFSIDHPLYIPILHLLEDKNILIIKDDNIKCSNRKYIVFTPKDNNIVLTIVNNEEKAFIGDKFRITLKKDSLDKETQRKMCIFLKETIKNISEKYHQITIEEHLIRKNGIQDEEVKKYIKSIRPNTNKRGQY